MASSVTSGLHTRRRGARRSLPALALLVTVTLGAAPAHAAPAPSDSPADSPGTGAQTHADAAPDPGVVDELPGYESGEERPVVGVATLTLAAADEAVHVQTSRLYWTAFEPDRDRPGRITVAAANDEPVLVADLVAKKDRVGPARLRGPIMFMHDDVVVSAKADGYWDPATSTFSGTYHGKQSVTGPTGEEHTLVLSGHLDLLVPEA